MGDRMSSAGSFVLCSSGDVLARFRYTARSGNVAVGRLLQGKGVKLTDVKWTRRNLTPEDIREFEAWMIEQMEKNHILSGPVSEVPQISMVERHEPTRQKILKKYIDEDKATDGH